MMSGQWGEFLVPFFLVVVSCLCLLCFRCWTYTGTYTVVSTIIRLSLQPNSTLTIINITTLKRCTLYEAIKSHAEKNFPVGCME